MADIEPPDLELRIAIIKNKAEQVNVHIPDDVLPYLGENLRSNIRQLEGAIKKLGALSFLSGKAINKSELQKELEIAQAEREKAERQEEQNLKIKEESMNTRVQRFLRN